MNRDKVVQTSMIYYVKSVNHEKPNSTYRKSYKLIFEKNDVRMFYDVTVTNSGSGYVGGAAVRIYDIRIYQGDNFLKKVKDRELKDVIIKYFGDSKMVNELNAKGLLKREYLPEIAVLYRYMGNS